MPSLFEVVVLEKDGYENLPEPEVPYYVVAREGEYLHKNTEIGTVLLKHHKELPLGRIGYAGGVFTWKGPVIPATILSQAHDFFRRIYAEHQTEAEVLITKHVETHEFRLFVPLQRVNGAGVKSIHEPTHIDRNYMVVGTIHSHCEMSAFHSGTDSGDASDMDGVHFTIGHVSRDEPEIVAMVAMNGKEFHYKDPKDIAEIEWGKATAPAWWDGFVYPGQVTIEKPSSFISISDEDWREFLGRALHKPKAATTWKPYSHGKDTHPRWSTTPNYSKGWYGDGWDPMPVKKEFAKTNERFEQLNAALDFAEDNYLFAQEEWKDQKASDVDEIAYWQGFFVTRLQKLAELLEILDVDVKVTAKPVKGKSK